MGRKRSKLWGIFWDVPTFEPLGLFYILCIAKMYRGKNYLTKTAEGLEVNSKLYLETLERLDYEDEDALENAGFVYVCGDNTYNYEDKRILTETMQRDLYMRKNPKGRGYNYAVVVRLHQGGDVRYNYKLAGVYKTNENCFSYMVRLCDAWHIARRYNNTKDYHKSDIEATKKEL